MIIFKCDRCGRPTSEPVYLQIRPTHSQVKDTTAYDLCPDCADALEDWLSDAAAVKVGTAGVLNALAEAFHGKEEE